MFENAAPESKCRPGAPIYQNALLICSTGTGISGGACLDAAGVLATHEAFKSHIGQKNVEGSGGGKEMENERKMREEVVETRRAQRSGDGLCCAEIPRPGNPAYVSRNRGMCSL